MTPAEVVAAHPIGYRTPSMGRVWCGCGANFGTRDAHAAHVLDALTKAGHVVVTLPEATSEGGSDYINFGPEVFIGGDGFVYSGAADYLPTEARDLAAALLAAAAAAETGGKA